MSFIALLSLLLRGELRWVCETHKKRWRIGEFFFLQFFSVLADFKYLQFWPFFLIHFTIFPNNSKYFQINLQIFVARLKCDKSIIVCPIKKRYLIQLLCLNGEIRLNALKKEFQTISKKFFVVFGWKTKTNRKKKFNLMPTLKMPFSLHSLTRHKPSQCM